MDEDGEEWRWMEIFGRRWREIEMKTDGDGDWIEMDGWKWMDRDGWMETDGWMEMDGWIEMDG